MIMFFVIWVAYNMDACNRINAQWGPVKTQSILSKVLTIYAPSFTHGGELCGVYRWRIFYICHRCLILHTVRPLIQDAAYSAIKLLITQM